MNMSVFGTSNDNESSKFRREYIGLLRNTVFLRSICVLYFHSVLALNQLTTFTGVGCMGWSCTPAYTYLKWHGHAELHFPTTTAFQNATLTM